MLRLNIISRPGMSKKTVVRLQIMLLIRTMPISAPILNCMVVSATSPETVVRLLEEISMIALERALISASRAGSVSRYSI